MNKHIFILLIVLLSSCRKDEQTVPYQTYIHLSHTRTNENSTINESLKEIHFENYDITLLGGDLALNTTEDIETMNTVDSIFNLSNPNTLWSLGNHDYNDLVLAEQFSNRPSYYAYYFNRITFLVLDTQDSLSNMVGDQLDLIQNVTDTIEESTHLIILHHKLIWMYDHPVLENQISSVSNGGSGDCFHCLNPNNFYIDVYPRLIDVESKGIEVLCLGGDIGFKTNEFAFSTEEGIQFLASGISIDGEENKVLIFYHDVINGKLTWEFSRIEDLK